MVGSVGAGTVHWFVFSLSAFKGKQTGRKKTNDRNHTANHWTQSLVIDKWESEIVQSVESAGKSWEPVYDWFWVPSDLLNGQKLSSDWLLEHLSLRFLAGISICATDFSIHSLNKPHFCLITVLKIIFPASNFHLWLESLHEPNS